MATGDFTNLDRDHRCPYCGKPVIGTFVQGAEGRYHPECTKPDPVIGMQPYQPPMPPGPTGRQEPIEHNPYRWPMFTVSTTGHPSEGYTIINGGQ